MNNTAREEILDTLSSVMDPDHNSDIVSLGMISSLQVSMDGDVILLIEVDPERGTALENIRQEAERKIERLQNIRKVSVVLTAEKKAPQQNKASDPHGMDKNPIIEVPAKNIIVVASGKGGVGKSTVSSNLAVFLGKNAKVGLLDADIYGPSQPLMMGDQEYKPELNAEKQMIPMERHGIKIMSIGFMVEKGKAMVWRGPMAQKALYQMLRDVAWASVDDPLDYLIIDLPPGTGDIQLTLAQKVRTTGAIIVSTPQDISLIDAHRAVEMFGKTGVPVLGLVENMSTHICSNCGHEEHIFGHGGAEREAKSLGIPFLGSIPLSKNIRLKSDEGTPIVIAEPTSTEAAAFQKIIEKITTSL